MLGADRPARMGGSQAGSNRARRRRVTGVPSGRGAGAPARRPTCRRGAARRRSRRPRRSGGAEGKSAPMRSSIRGASSRPSSGRRPNRASSSSEARGRGGVGVPAWSSESCTRFAARSSSSGRAPRWRAPRHRLRRRPRGTVSTSLLRRTASVRPRPRGSARRRPSVGSPSSARTAHRRLGRFRLEAAARAVPEHPDPDPARRGRAVDRARACHRGHRHRGDRAAGGRSRVRAGVPRGTRDRGVEHAGAAPRARRPWTSSPSAAVSAASYGQPSPVQTAEAPRQSPARASANGSAMPLWKLPRPTPLAASTERAPVCHGSPRPRASSMPRSSLQGRRVAALEPCCLAAPPRPARPDRSLWLGQPATPVEKGPLAGIAARGPETAEHGERHHRRRTLCRHCAARAQLSPPPRPTVPARARTPSARRLCRGSPHRGRPGAVLDSCVHVAVASPN